MKSLAFLHSAHFVKKWEFCIVISIAGSIAHRAPDNITRPVGIVTVANKAGTQNIAIFYLQHVFP